MTADNPYAQRASNPQEPAESLEKMFDDFPLEVVSNPNVSITLLLDRVSNCNTMPVQKAGAILWATFENPLLPALRLENPSHPIFETLAWQWDKFQIRLLIETLEPADLGVAFVESMKLFLEIAERYQKMIGPDGSDFASWLRCLSRLWQVVNGQITYEESYLKWLHLTIISNSAHPVSGVLRYINQAMNLASQLQWQKAFDVLLRLPYQLYNTERYIESMLRILQEASWGENWPDPTLESLEKLRLGGVNRRKLLSHGF